MSYQDDEDYKEEAAATAYGCFAWMVVIALCITGLFWGLMEML